MKYVTGKDGTKFNSAALTYVAKIIPNILVVQLVQKEIGSLDVNILPDKNFNKESIQETLKGIQERIGKGNMNIAINVINRSQLIYTKSNGKLEMIVNQTVD